MAETRHLTSDEHRILYPEVRELERIADEYRTQQARLTRLAQGLFGASARFDADRLIVSTPDDDA